MVQDKSNNRQATRAVVSSVVGYILDAMDMQFLAATLPLLIVAFGINKVQAGQLATLQMIGVGVGGVLAGFLADRVGRVKTLTYTIVVFALCTGFLAFVQNAVQFGILRFIASLGLGGEWAVGAVLMAEYLSTKKRAIGSGVVQCGWPIGIILASSVAAFVLHLWVATCILRWFLAGDRCILDQAVR